MQKNEKNKNLLFLILLIFLISLSIAYATLTQYLYINSQSTVIGLSSGWQVEFTAVTCRATGSASITQDFTMTTTNLSGLKSKFARAGDSIICDIKITNSGYVDAKLSTFVMQDGTLTYTGMGTHKTEDEAIVNGKLQHSIVYGVGDAREGQVPATDDPLPSGTTRDLVLTIKYPDGAPLPENDVLVEGLTSTFLYVQS